MEISIVMAYHNRRNLLIKTLESIVKTQFKGSFEIVVVDDASIESHCITDLLELFPKLNIKVVQIDKKDKWWVNPCIPNNIGLEVASGDIIIIQNPECLHMGDIISYVDKNIIVNKYIVFGCYAVDYPRTKLISKVGGGSTEDIYKIISPTNDVPLDFCPSLDRWYQHSKFSPRCLNFCTAITKTDVEDLGGFDEVYARGQCYDDTEFIRRVYKKGMYVCMVDQPFVVHQCHGYASHGNKRLLDLNINLFNAAANSDSFRVSNKHIIKEYKNA
jgi:glycosyltransferase involved in cell wall biosynthesis